MLSMFEETPYNSNPEQRLEKLKGTVPRDFRLQVFFMNQFPQAPEYPIRAISNWNSNSRTPEANGKIITLKSFILTFILICHQYKKHQWCEETPYNFTFLANPEQWLEKLKRTVPRDFRLQVFFMNQFPPST